MRSHQSTAARGGQGQPDPSTDTLGIQSKVSHGISTAPTRQPSSHLFLQSSPTIRKTTPSQPPSRNVSIMPLNASQRRRVFQTCKTLFTGPLTEIRQPKAITKVISGN